MGHLRVLIIDDEKNIRKTLSLCLEEMGCRVSQASNAEAALALVEQEVFDLAFLDLRLGQTSGMDLIPRLLAANPTLAIIIITAYATIETAVEALKQGAHDYLSKPFTPAQIRLLVERLEKQNSVERRLLNLQSRLRESVPEIDLETSSTKMKAAIDKVAKAAAFDVPVLFRGESGTGKGVLAQFLHSMSPRKEYPFVVVNCPTLSEELLTSELFGHVTGAFTGATRDRKGRVESAEKGTLFLDEIGEMPPNLQAKLLTFIQEKKYERLGDNLTRKADVRIVAATNRHLDEEVRTGHFREDLFYRLNTIEVLVPPLRERPEDIPKLVTSFLAFFTRSTKKRLLEISPVLLDALSHYEWPGNVRELRNAIERAIILSNTDVLDRCDFPFLKDNSSTPAKHPNLGGHYSLQEIEAEHIGRVVGQTSTMEEAAKILGIDVSTLWRWRKKQEGV